MPPLLIEPAPGNDSDLGRGRGRNGRRASFERKSDDKRIRRSRTEGDLQVAEDSDPAAPKSPTKATSLSPGRFLSRRWSKDKGRKERKSKPEGGRRFGRRKSKGEDPAARNKSSKSLSPGVKRQSLFKHLKSLLTSPTSPRIDRRDMIPPTDDADEDSDSAPSVGPPPFAVDNFSDDDGPNMGSGDDVQIESVPTAEITVPNLDAWASDDDSEGSIPDGKGVSSKKIAPKKKPAGDVATPVVKNTKRETDKRQKATKNDGEEKEEIQAPSEPYHVPLTQAAPRHPPFPAGPFHDSLSSSGSSFKVNVSEPGKRKNSPLPSSLERFNQSESAIQGSKASKSKTNNLASMSNSDSDLGRRKKLDPPASPRTPRKKASKVKATRGMAAKGYQKASSSPDVTKSPTRKLSGQLARASSLPMRAASEKSVGKATSNPKKTKKEKSPVKTRASAPVNSWRRPLHEEEDGDARARPVRSNSQKNRTVGHNSAPLLKTNSEAPLLQGKEEDQQLLSAQNSLLFPDPAIDFKKQSSARSSSKSSSEEYPDGGNPDPKGRVWKMAFPPSEVRLGTMKEEPIEIKVDPASLKHKPSGGSSPRRTKRPSDASFGPFPEPPSVWIDSDRAAQSEGETVEGLTKEIDNLMDETAILRNQLSAAWDKIANLTKRERVNSLPPNQDSGGFSADDELSSSSTDPFAEASELNTRAPSASSLTEAADIITLRDDSDTHERGSLISQTKALSQELEATNGKMAQLDSHNPTERSKSASGRERRKTSKGNSAAMHSPIPTVIDMSGTLSQAGEPVSTIQGSGTKPIEDSGSTVDESSEIDATSFDEDAIDDSELYQSYGSFAVKYNDSGNDFADNRRTRINLTGTEETKTPISCDTTVGPITASDAGESSAKEEFSIAECLSPCASQLPTVVKGSTVPSGSNQTSVPSVPEDPAARGGIDEGLAEQQHTLAQRLEEWRVELEEKEDRLSEELRGVKGKNKDLDRRQKEMENMFENWKQRLETKEEKLKENEAKAKTDREEYSRLQEELDRTVQERLLEQNDMRRKISRVTRLHMELNLNLKNKVARIAILVKDLSKVTLKLEKKAEEGEPIGPELKSELRVIQSRIKKQLNDFDNLDVQTETDRGNNSSLSLSAGSLSLGNLSSGSLSAGSLSAGNLSTGSINNDMSSLQHQTQTLKMETDRLLGKLKRKQTGQDVSFSSSSKSSVDYDRLVKEVKQLRDENKNLRSGKDKSAQSADSITKKRDVFVADMQAEVESLLKELTEKRGTENTHEFEREQLVLKALNRALVVKLAMEPNVETGDTKKHSAAIRSMKREIEKLRKELIESEPEQDDVRDGEMEEEDAGEEEEVEAELVTEDSRDAARGQTSTVGSLQPVDNQQPLQPVEEDFSLHVGLTRSNVFLHDE